MNRAKEHRRRPKSPPLQRRPLRCAPGGRGTSAYSPFLLSSRTRRRSNAAKSPRGVASPRRPFLTFSALLLPAPEQSRRCPGTLLISVAPPHSCGTQPLRPQAGTGRCRASARSSTPHVSPSAAPDPYSPCRSLSLLTLPVLTFPRSSRFLSPHPGPVSGHKKKHVKRRAFLFLRSDAALERTGRSSPKKHGRFRQQRQPESGGSRRLRHDAPIKSRTSAAAKAAEPARAPFPAGSGTLICLQSDTTADRMTRSLRMTRTPGPCRLQKRRIAGTTS